MSNGEYEIKTDFPCLLAPIKIGGLTFKNRIIGAPSSLADYGPGGHLTQENIAFYEMRARGGAACVTLGESIVDMDTGLSHHTQIPLRDYFSKQSLTEAADAIHAHGSYASIELSHGGNRCDSGRLKRPYPIGPSAGVSDWGEPIMEMTEDMIMDLVKKYGESAKFVKDCGFDMLLVHGAHSWLLHQFISETSNHRRDDYGGRLENRMRFPLLVIEEIRKNVGPGFPIEFRMSGSELCDGGYGIDTGVEIARMLDGKVDIIHVSAGVKGNAFSNVLMHPSFFQAHGANVWLASEIKKHVKTPVAAVGALSIPEKMEELIASGAVDLLAMARGLMADPYMPRKLEEGRRCQVISCLRCLECEGSMALNNTTRCTVNPEIGREYRVFHTPPATSKKKVLIAGGGPGGMQAAITACERGHEVVLCEAGPRLGGALKFADGVDFKEMVRRYRDTQIHRVCDLPIKVRLNTPVDETVVNEEKPDVLIAAVGAVPIVPPLPGADGANVLVAANMTPETRVGKNVVIIGGGAVGCEMGIHLYREGHRVTVLEMRDELVADCTIMDKVAHEHEIELAVEGKTGMTCRAISAEGVTAEDKDGKELFYPADTVILAVGLRARSDDVEKLRGLCRRFYVVGDCARARKIMNAVREGYDAAMDLA